MNSKVLLFFFSIYMLSFYACNQPSENQTYSPYGLWEQDGYGKIIEIKDSLVKIYDICKVNCNASFEEVFIEFGAIKKVGQDELILTEGLNDYYFKRLEKLPPLCSNQDENQQRNPVYNFETLWHTFNEQYCYFQKRNINWEEKYKHYKAQINQQTTDLELFVLCEEMLESIGDGHVGFELPNELEDVYKQLKQEEPIEDTKAKPPINTYLLEQKLQTQLAAIYTDSTNIRNGGVIKWGWMKDQVVYIQINWMFLLADYGVPDELPLHEFAPKYIEIGDRKINQRQDEVDGADEILDHILKQTKGAAAYILDIRFNGGGKDDAALNILDHFIAERKQIGVKKAKLEKGFSKPTSIYIEPATITFDGPLYLLTSHRSASATEILTMAALSFDNVISIGSNTEGIFSDQLDKKLPNGWEYTLSNEIYEDMQGNDYESIGIPANYPIEYSKDKVTFFTELLEPLEAGKGDEAIELALRLFKERKK